MYIGYWTLNKYYYYYCDNNCHDNDFINILNDVSLLFYKYNSSHVVFGGDMNVDLSRTSPNSRILTDLITDLNLLPCIDLSQIKCSIYIYRP